MLTQQVVKERERGRKRRHSKGCGWINFNGWHTVQVQKVVYASSASSSHRLQHNRVGFFVVKQGSKNVFESGRQFGEWLVAKLSLVSRSEIPEVNKSLLSLLRPFRRLYHV